MLSGISRDEIGDGFEKNVQERGFVDNQAIYVNKSPNLLSLN